jgi:ABC-type sugar transport system permease subunit
MANTQNSNSPATNATHQIGIVVCMGLAIIGIFQIFTNRLEDGIINIIIGSSLSFSFFPFDYDKAPRWQKALVMIYALLLLAGIAYILYTGFTK